MAPRGPNDFSDPEGSSSLIKVELFHGDQGGYQIIIMEINRQKCIMWPN